MFSKLFTLLIVFFPILSIYVTFIPNLSYADLLLIIFFPTIILSKFKTKFIHISTFPIIFFFVYLIVTLFIQIFYRTGVGTFSTVRYSMYLLALTLSYSLFDFNFAIKIINKVTNIISYYVIIQFFSFFFFLKILPWKIPGLSLVDAKFDAAPDDFFLQFYRPTGIFLEPTHFVQFAIVTLCFYIVMNIFNNSRFNKCIIPTIAIVVSGSSLGLISLVIIYSYWVSKKYLLDFRLKNLFLILIIISVLITLLGSIEYFRYIIIRLIGTDGSIFGAAVGYRFDSVEYFLNGNLSFADWMIGRGRSSEDIYFTGIFYILNANGILGIVIYFTIIYVLLSKSSTFGKFLTTVVFILSFGSELIANFGILFYLSFVLGEIYLRSKQPYIFKN